MGNNAQGGFAGGNPLSGASGSGTMTPQSYGSSPMMLAGGSPTPMGGGIPGGNPFAAQQQAYMQYLSQALPSINAGLAAGTLKPGQAIPNFQGPQAFGLPQGYGGGTSQPLMGGGLANLGGPTTPVGAGMPAGAGAGGHK